jgi:hypothetical protein
MLQTALGTAILEEYDVRSGLLMENLVRSTA